MKRCPKCGIEKSLDDFHRSSNTKDGRQSWCKSCLNAAGKAWAKANPHSQRVRNWQNRGIKLTLEEYDILLEAQDGRCYWCAAKAWNKSLSVDHDHDTGEPRALTCNGCNRRFLAQAERSFKKGIRLPHCVEEYFRNPPAMKILGRKAA